MLEWRGNSLAILFGIMKLITQLKTKIKAYFELPPFTMEGLSFDDYFEWEAMVKKEYPVRYFVVETIPSALKTFRNKVWYDPMAWIIARTISKSHVLKIKSLKPGYPDETTIMLHANFQILANFVEKRLSQTNFSWWRDRKPSYLPEMVWDKVRWYARCPEAGKDHLRELTSDVMYSTAYADMKDLYWWWTEMYPRRLDEWADEKIWGEDATNSSAFMSVKVPGTSHRSTDVANELEKYYEDEDQEMLERLVKIRSSLWF